MLGFTYVHTIFHLLVALNRACDLAQLAHGSPAPGVYTGATSAKRGPPSREDRSRTAHRLAARLLNLPLDGRLEGRKAAARGPEAVGAPRTRGAGAAAEPVLVWGLVWVLVWVPVWVPVWVLVWGLVWVVWVLVSGFSAPAPARRGRAA